MLSQPRLSQRNSFSSLISRTPSTLHFYFLFFYFSYNRRQSVISAFASFRTSIKGKGKISDEPRESVYLFHVYEYNPLHGTHPWQLPWGYSSITSKWFFSCAQSETFQAPIFTAFPSQRYYRLQVCTYIKFIRKGQKMAVCRTLSTAVSTAAAAVGTRY